MSTSKSKSTSSKSKSKVHMPHDLVTALTEHLKLNDIDTLARLRASSKHVNDTFDKPITLNLLQLLERVSPYAVKQGKYGSVPFLWKKKHEFQCMFRISDTFFVFDLSYSPKYPDRVFKDPQKQFDYNYEQEELAAKAMNDVIASIFTDEKVRPRAIVHRGSIRIDWQVSSYKKIQNVNLEHATRFIQYVLREIVGSDTLPEVSGEEISPADKGKLTRLWKASVFYGPRNKTSKSSPKLSERKH